MNRLPICDSYCPTLSTMNAMQWETNKLWPWPSTSYVLGNTHYVRLRCVHCDCIGLVHVQLNTALHIVQNTFVFNASRGCCFDFFHPNGKYLWRALYSRMEIALNVLSVVVIHMKIGFIDWNRKHVLPKIVLFIYGFLLSPVQIYFPESQECFMTGGGLPGIYVMDQMHFHWASEHTINGER